MDIGKNIKTYRTQQKMTQKDLAEKLNVTFQAVSRWENNEVEPSLDILNKMSQIFNISVDQLMGKEQPAKEEINEEKSAPALQPVTIIQKEVVREVPVKERQVLCVCDYCNKPIYVDEPMMTRKQNRRGGSTTHRYHSACYEKMNQKILRDKIETGIKQRKKGWIVGSIVGILVAALAILMVCFILSSNMPIMIAGIIGSLIGGGLLMMLIFCAYTQNTVVGDVWLAVASWGFVKMPGLIFSLDLDGIIWLLTVKLVLWIISFIIAIAFIIIATVIGMILSIFFFPIAVKVSYSHPEKSAE